MSTETPSQSEDPLPTSVDHSYYYANEAPSGLGELVVTDPRDPFTWTSAHNLRLSTEGRDILWLVYRLDGNFPQQDKDYKYRDDLVDMNKRFEHLDKYDLYCIEAYQRHLARIDF